MYKKVIIIITTLLSISGCSNSNTENKKEKEGLVASAVSQYDIFTQKCEHLHTITRSNAEYYIYLDSLRSHHFEQKNVDIDGNMISLHHNLQNNSVDKTAFFSLLDSIQGYPRALLFVGYEVLEKDTSESKLTFSNTCLNIYGATIENSKTRKVFDSSFYIGSGCDKNTLNVLKRDSIINKISTKYPGFEPKSNKFGVVYNAKCLLEALSSNFEGDSVYIDIAYNDKPTNGQRPHQVFVFSDHSNLRVSALSNTDLKDIRSLFSQKKPLRPTLDSLEKYAPTSAYADNGASCCPI